MPLISVHTNVKVEKKTADTVKAACGSAITLLPGKTEDWLMVEIEGDKALYFKGSDAPCAFAEVKIFGKSTAAAYDNLTSALCDVLSKALSVPGDRIYVKYEEISHWGWNGSNF